ncbi:equilibrative nucleoside transporter 4 [Mixophyes fleayi]|uniref:equilibrative nucleoside transporter 4 n=1 Tax=Mixophyes fleayi TaxID=3061075 RepID=UPI003F4E15C6
MQPAKRDCYREPSPSLTPEGNVVMSYSFDSCQLEEEELQARGGHRAQGVLELMEPDANSEPQDRYHGIYFAMLLAGVGFLLPYNSFITDVDYLHQKFPGTSIVFDMSLTYILVALAAVVLNNAMVELLATHMRITVGYLLAVGPLIFIGICDIWLEIFTIKQSYAINLFAVGVVAFGCTVQQSSFYGYTGMLPKRYAQGVMTGETLTRKGADPKVWQPTAVSAFEALKHAFVSAPVLKHPNPDLHFIVEVDASDVGVGAVLSQKYLKDHRLHPCAYLSRKFSSAEERYDVGNLSEPCSIIPGSSILIAFTQKLVETLQQCQPQAPSETPVGKLFVPIHLRKSVLSECCDNKASGHPAKPEKSLTRPRRDRKEEDTINPLKSYTVTLKVSIPTVPLEIPVSIAAINGSRITNGTVEFSTKPIILQENRATTTENSMELQSDLTTRGTYVRFDVPVPKLKSSWPNFREMTFHRYLVFRVIWAYMLSISVTYFITLCIFPGLVSEIKNCTMGEWLPILIMAVFNLSDFVGKILAALPYDWSGINLLICSSMRVAFIPLFIMCVYPSEKPTFGHPAWPCVFSLLMGITNGYFGSVPMILASGQVVPEQQELAGNTMTVSYMTGLTLGSTVSYFAYSLASTSQSICFSPQLYNSSLPPEISI